MVTQADIGKRAYVILKAGFRDEVKMREEGEIVSITLLPDGRIWCEIDTGNGGSVSGPVDDFFIIDPALQPTGTPSCQTDFDFNTKTQRTRRI